MIIRSHRFEFDAPDGWQAQQDSGRLTLHGPQNEELIVSGVVQTGAGRSEDAASLTGQLLENAKKGMRAAAAHPDLELIWDIRRDESIGPIECWTTHSETRDRSVMFSQAAFVRPGAVLLLTFEAPNGPTEHDVLLKVLKSIRPLPTN
jgi:hypothetical protein